MSTYLFGFLIYQFIMRFVIADFLSTCQSGLDQTIYAKDLISQIKLTSEMKLPQRYIGSIYLKYGGMFNISSPNLIDRPVRVVCANDSLGALQIKISINNVILAYSWSYSEKCEGVAKTMPQDIFIDLNIEKNERDRKTRILGSYTTALTQTDFSILFKKCNYLNVRMLEEQVQSVCKKAVLHDVDMILQSQIKSLVNDFIEKNELFLY